MLEGRAGLRRSPRSAANEIEVVVLRNQVRQETQEAFGFVDEFRLGPQRPQARQRIKHASLDFPQKALARQRAEGETAR